MVVGRDGVAPQVKVRWRVKSCRSWVLSKFWEPCKEDVKMKMHERLKIFGATKTMFIVRSVSFGMLQSINLLMEGSKLFTGPRRSWVNFTTSCGFFRQPSFSRIHWCVPLSFAQTASRRTQSTFQRSHKRFRCQYLSLSPYYCVEFRTPVDKLHTGWPTRFLSISHYFVNIFNSSFPAYINNLSEVIENELRDISPFSSDSFAS